MLQKLKDLTKNCFSQKEKKVSILLSIAVLLIFALYLFFFKTQYRLDLTQNQSFTLSPKSLEIIKNISFKVKVTVLQQDQTPDLTLGSFGKEIYMNLKNLLVEYKKASPWIEIEYLDPNSEEAKARNYKIKNVGDVSIESEKGKKYLNKEYLVEWGARRNSNTGEFERLITAYKIEEKITAALLSLFEKNKPKILWLEGDGEIMLEGQTSASVLQEELLNNNLMLEKTTLNNQEQELIESASAIIIAGPVKTIPEVKIKLIEKFLNAGKTLILLFDPSLDEYKTGLEQLLEKHFAVRVKNHIVADDYYSYQTIANIAGFYTDHAVNQELQKQNMQTILFLAAPFEIKEDKDPMIQIEPLLIASHSAWEEKNMKAVKKTGRLDLSKKYELKMMTPGEKKDEKEEHEHGHDHSKHKDIYLSAVSSNKATGSKLLIAGDSDFIRNTNIGISGNKDFIINAINYLLERKTPLSISKPLNTERTVLVQDGSKKYYFAFYVILLPFLVAAIGLWIGLKRRRMKTARKG